MAESNPPKIATLNLSRLGQRHRIVKIGNSSSNNTSIDSNQQQQQARLNTGSNYYRAPPIPSSFVDLGNPIPSSFVDLATSAACNSTVHSATATTARFPHQQIRNGSDDDGNSSSSDDDDPPPPTRTKPTTTTDNYTTASNCISSINNHSKVAAAKEAIRQKLNLCKTELLLSSSTTTSNNNEPFPTKEQQQHPQQRFATNQQHVAAAAATATIPRLTAPLEEHPPLNTHPPNGPLLVPQKQQQQQLAQSLVVSHDERSLLPLSNILQGSTIITTTASRQQQQPEASLLLSAIEHVFALKCQQPDGLESCTLKQFLTAIQANFPTIAFLKETRLAVRERVTFLVKQHIANKKKATTTITLAHLTKTNVSETNVEIPPPTRRKQPDETVVLFETKEFYRVPTTNNKKEIEEISAPNITNPSKATGQYGCHSPPSSSTPKSGCDMDDTAKNINDDSMVPIARVAQSINQTAPIIAKPKQPRARRGKNAACQHSGTTVVESCNPMESVTTTATIIAPPPPRGRHVPLGRRVETKARCNLCTKCPCQHKARESSGSRTSLDFAQTDAAIERALIKRLLKLEMVTDQYDEQTDAARRQLKKHRREIWKKREEKRARDEGTNTASVSRFLPDAEECQHLALDANRNKRHRATIVANAKENLFGVRSTTNQQTLTQMLASGKESGIEDPESRTCEDHTLDDTNGFVDLSSPLSTRSNIDKNSTICATISANIADGMRQPVSPLYSIGEPHSALKPPPKDASEYSSLWDAVRLGHCESSWDLLFVDKSEEAHGVDHLLGLLGGDQNEAQPFNSPSQSSISAQGQSLAAALTERIGGNSKTLSFLEQWCPNWRENVAYAMRQKNKVDIADALHNVKDRQARLKAVRKELWRKLEQEEAVLKVFQESLEQSLTRFATPQPKDASGEGFFLSQREPCSPFPKCAAFVKHRQSFESEVGTIIATAFSPSQNECAS